VEYDLSVLQSVQKRKPLAQQYPIRPPPRGIERAVSALLTLPGTRPKLLLSPETSPPWTIIDCWKCLQEAASKEIQQSYQLLKRAYDPDAPFRYPGLSAGEILKIASLLENAYRT